MAQLGKPLVDVSSPSTASFSCAARRAISLFSITNKVRPDPLLNRAPPPPPGGRISPRRVVEHQHPVWPSPAHREGKGARSGWRPITPMSCARPSRGLKPPRPERKNRPAIAAGDRERATRVGIDEQVVAALRGEQPIVLLAAARDHRSASYTRSKYGRDKHQRLQVAHLTGPGIVEASGPEVRGE